MKSSHALRQLGRRALTSAVALVVLAIGAVGLSPAAQAATATPLTAVAGHTAASTSASTATISIHVHGPASVGSNTVKPDTTSCTITAKNPTTSAYGAGGVGVVACTGNVYEIVLVVALFYGSTEESYTTVTAYNGSEVSTADYTPDITGYWQTGAVADVYWSSPSSYSQLGPVYSPSTYLL